MSSTCHQHVIHSALKSVSFLENPMSTDVTRNPEHCQVILPSIFRAAQRLTRPNFSSHVAIYQWKGHRLFSRKMPGNDAPDPAELEYALSNVTSEKATFSYFNFVFSSPFLSERARMDLFLFFHFGSHPKSRG
jgi:hypothetical protein